MPLQQHLPEPTRPAGRLRRTGREDDRHIFIDAVIEHGECGHRVDWRRDHFELPDRLKCAAPVYSVAYPDIPRIGARLHYVMHQS